MAKRTVIKRATTYTNASNPATRLPVSPARKIAPPPGKRMPTGPIKRRPA